jgi:hypothetical protein
MTLQQRAKRVLCYHKTTAFCFTGTISHMAARGAENRRTRRIVSTWFSSTVAPVSA